MSVLSTICPFCQHEFFVDEKLDKWSVDCPACKKGFIAQMSRHEEEKKSRVGVIKEQITEQPTQFSARKEGLVEAQIPDGYHTAMFYVRFLQVVGWIVIISGIVFGLVIGSKGDRYSDNFNVLNFIISAIGGILLALPYFIFAAFLHLFCGLSKNTAYNTAYLEVLAEKELK